MNPYDFVPLGQPSARRPAPGHMLLSAQAGVIRARMTTLGPFLIGTQIAAGQGQIVPLKQGQIVPGSSLKGMLRSMAEVVGGGCISLSSSLFHGGGRYPARLADGFRPCATMNALCITCRMFGALNKGEAWKGQVQPGEMRWQGQGTPPLTPQMNFMVGQPKPEHLSFYTQNGAVRGRKVYYHHPERLMTSPAPNKVAFGMRQVVQVRAVTAGQSYEFALHHQGLDAQEYALLLYVLFLDGTLDLAHKLGWGKPMGLGSVRIEPLLIEEVDLRARYRRGGDQAQQRYAGEAAVRRVGELTTAIRGRRDEVMTGLRSKLRYPEPVRVGTKWAYPSFDWFKANPQKTLEEFNDRGE